MLFALLLLPHIVHQKRLMWRRDLDCRSLRRNWWIYRDEIDYLQHSCILHVSCILFCDYVANCIQWQYNVHYACMHIYVCTSSWVHVCTKSCIVLLLFRTCAHICMHYHAMYIHIAVSLYKDQSIMHSSIHQTCMLIGILQAISIWYVLKYSCFFQALIKENWKYIYYIYTCMLIPRTFYWRVHTPIRMYNKLYMLYTIELNWMQLNYMLVYIHQ